MTAFTPGDTSGSTTLVDNQDTAKAGHINEMRTAITNLESMVNYDDQTVTGSGDFTSHSDKLVKPFITVGTSGAVDYLCDGTADDVQIQAALDAVNTAGGGMVFIKAGTYNISAWIKMRTGVWVVGEGPMTILKIPNSTLSSLTQPSDISTLNLYWSVFVNASGSDTTNSQYPQHDFGLRDLTIDVNRQNNSAPSWRSDGYFGFCFDFIHVYNVKIQNCYFKNGLGAGGYIYPRTTANPLIKSHITDNVFDSCGDGTSALSGGLFISNGTDVERGITVIGNHFYSCNKYGLMFEDGRGSLANGNVIRGSTSHGIFLQASGTLSLTGNKCVSNGGSGIYGTNSRHVAITGNTCMENDEHGIKLDGFHDSTVCGNVCSWNDEAGIYVDSYGTTINGNSCVSNGSGSSPTTPYGIYLVNGDKNTVVGNVCAYDVNSKVKTDSQTYGIYCAAGWDGVSIIALNQLFQNVTGGLYLGSTLNKYDYIVGNLDSNSIGFTCREGNQSVVDDGTILLPDASNGWGFAQIQGGTEYGQFSFKNDGTVTLINNSANCVNTDTDVKFCIFDSGTGVTIKNRLGSTANIIYKVWYNPT